MAKTLTLIEGVGKSGWDKNQGSCVQFMGKRRMIQGRLMMDYEKEGDGIFWVMQRTLCLKAVYTEWDRYEKMMYDNAITLSDGEIVEIWKIKDYGDRLEDCGKKQYKFKAFGDYSDCGIFEEVK